MCVYNKKNMCIYVCVWGYLDKYISVATWPPQIKIPGSALDCTHCPYIDLASFSLVAKNIML